jgi:hypothetical protein
MEINYITRFSDISIKCKMNVVGSYRGPGDSSVPWRGVAIKFEEREPSPRVQPIRSQGFSTVISFGVIITEKRQQKEVGSRFTASLKERA